MAHHRQAAGGVAPGAGAIGGGGTEQGGAVIDLDGRARLGGAGEGESVVVGDVVAEDPRVSGEQGDAGGQWSGGIDGDVESGGGHPRVAGNISGGGGQAVGAVGEGSRRVGPGAAAIGGGGTEQSGAVIDLDGAARLGGAVEGQRVVVGDVVADGAAVGGEGGDARGQRGRGVDGDVESG